MGPEAGWTEVGRSGSVRERGRRADVEELVARENRRPVVGRTEVLGA